MKMRVTVFVVVVLCWMSASEADVANLTEACFRCLCMAPTGCSASKRCFGDFCGPFHLSKQYWLDAGQPILQNDDPERMLAFEDCAKDYECAKTIVAAYLEKFVTDCNNDGVIDCFDHLMVNANGGYDCSRPLNTTTVGQRWLAAYEKCKVDL